MVKSMFIQYEEIEALLEPRSSCLLEDGSKSTLTEMIDFLEPFKETSDKLEQDKHSTLPLVPLYFAKLARHLSVDPSGTSVIARLKRAKKFLEDKLQLEEVHKLATFLFPQFRQLHMLPERERNAVYDSARQKLAHDRTRECAEAKDNFAPPQKRARVDEFDEWCDVEVELEPKEEIE